MSDNNDGDGGLLSNRDHLFTFLTAIIKRSGGKLVITEAEIEKVTKNDLVTVKYDPKAKSIIFEVDSAPEIGEFKLDPNIRKDN